MKLEQVQQKMHDVKTALRAAADKGDREEVTALADEYTQNWTPADKGFVGMCEDLAAAVYYSN